MSANSRSKPNYLFQLEIIYPIGTLIPYILYEDPIIQMWSKSTMWPDLTAYISEWEHKGILESPRYQQKLRMGANRSQFGSYSVKNSTEANAFPTQVLSLLLLSTWTVLRSSVARVWGIDIPPDTTISARSKESFNELLNLLCLNILLSHFIFIWFPSDFFLTVNKHEQQ